jgi:hypothetical protein
LEQAPWGCSPSSSWASWISRRISSTYWTGPAGNAPSFTPRNRSTTFQRYLS